MAAAPLPARTQLQLVAGVLGPPRVPPKLSVASDSPLITSFAFIDWEVPAPPARALADRAELVGAILMAMSKADPAAQAPIRWQRGRGRADNYTCQWGNRPQNFDSEVPMMCATTYTT